MGLVSFVVTRMQQLLIVYSSAPKLGKPLVSLEKMCMLGFLIVWFIYER